MQGPQRRRRACVQRCVERRDAAGAASATRFLAVVDQLTPLTAADGRFGSLSRKQITRLRCTTEECRVTIENLTAVAADTTAPAKTYLSMTIMAIAEASGSKRKGEK